MHHTSEESWNHTGPGDLTSFPLQDPDRSRYEQTAEFIVTEKTPEFQHRHYSSSVVSSASIRWPGKGYDSFWGHQGWDQLLKNGQAHICVHSCSKMQDQQEILALMNCWVSRAGSRKRTKNINVHQLVEVHHEPFHDILEYLDFQGAHKNNYRPPPGPVQDTPSIPPCA